MTITIHVDGIPKARPRTKSTSKNGHKWHYTPKTDKVWLEQVAIEAKKACPSEPLSGPIRFEVYFWMPRCKRLMRKSDPDGLLWHFVKPDASNLIKGIEDTFTRLGMWRDDCQIASLSVGKYYHPKDGAPGCTINISRLSDGEIT